MGGIYDDKKFHQISFLRLNKGFLKFRISEQKIRNPVRNKIPGKCSGISGTGIPHKPAFNPRNSRH